MRALPLALALIAPLSLLALSSSCGGGCQTNFDCGAGSYCDEGSCVTECSTDLDCQQPPECRSDPLSCRPKGERCDGSGRCIGEYTAVTRGTDLIPSSSSTTSDGWDDAPGSGAVFVMSKIQINGAESVAVHVDGANATYAFDNKLSFIASLANERINEGIKRGETIILMEVAGLDEGYRGDDDSVTLKFYDGIDADDPIDPENNGAPGARFYVKPSSLDTSGAHIRSKAAARIQDGIIRSTGVVPGLVFSLLLSPTETFDIGLARPVILARLPQTLNSIEDGILFAAVPARDLHEIDNLACVYGSSELQWSAAQCEDSSFLDLALFADSSAQPDVSLLGQTPGCLAYDATSRHITACGSCGSERTPCDWDNNQDAYSVTMNMSGVRATASIQ